MTSTAEYTSDDGAYGQPSRSNFARPGSLHTISYSVQALSIQMILTPHSAALQHERDTRYAQTLETSDFASRVTPGVVERCVP